MHDFVREFDYACQIDNEAGNGAGKLEQNIKKTIIDLDPLTVYNLFKSIRFHYIVYNIWYTHNIYYGLYTACDFKMDIMLTNEVNHQCR